MFLFIFIGPVRMHPLRE